MFPRLSETFILNEIVELERLGVKLHIFSSKYPTDAVSHEKVKVVNAQVTYLPEELGAEKLRILKAFFSVLVKYPVGTLSTFGHELKIKIFKANSKSLKRFFQSCCIIEQLEDIKHIHAHFITVPTRLVSLVYKITGISYSISTHAKDLYFEDRMNASNIKRRIRASRFVIANSKKSASDIKTSLSKIYATDIHTVYNGLDLSMFKFREKEPENPVILGVGRLEEKKGFACLIDACKILADRGISFRCKIVGDGSLKELLSDLIKKNKLSDIVELIESLPQHELVELYNESMIFSLPCVVTENGDRDVLPNVVKEAMAIGLPVVTTSIPAMDELVMDGKSGILVAERDSLALSDALQKLIDDPRLRKSLALEGRKVIEDKFNTENNVLKLKNILSEIIAEKAIVSQRSDEAKSFLEEGI